MKVILAIIFILLSCSKENVNGPPYKAKIITSYFGSYELTTATFNSIQNFDSLQGEYADMYGNTVINANPDELEGVILSDNPDKIYKDIGSPVQLNYEVKDSIVYAKDFDTLEMLSLFFNYEKTFEYWKDNFAFNISTFGKPRLIFNPTLEVSSSSASLSETGKLNAAFFPGPRDFLIFKTSKLEQIPFCMNWAIIAHEFGHAVFDYKFAHKDVSFYSTNYASNEFLLHGINEGIADYFSYTVVGRKNEFQESLSIMEERRTPPVSWTYSNINTKSFCKDNYYCIGSVLHSALYEISQYTGQDRLKVAKVLYNSFEGFRQDWQENKNTKNFPVYYLLNRIIEQADSTDKSVYCTYFTKWFDDITTKDHLQCN